MKAINWSSVKAQEQGKGFQPLPVGAYECVIMNAVDDPARESVTLDLEIASGEHKGYYTNNPSQDGTIRYGKLFLSYADDSYNSVGRFKAFVTALEHSNPNFHWDGKSESMFMGKRIGVVFGEREYMGNDGQVHTGTNARYPISLARIESGDYSIPRKKLLNNAASAPAAASTFTVVENEPLPWENM